jgi:hypothetical protein
MTQASGRDTFVPLAFAPGVAFQFDWNEDRAVLAGERVKLQVAHTELSHSKAFIVRAYLLQAARRPRTARLMPKFSVSRSVPYTAEQVLAIARDVARYKESLQLVKRYVVHRTGLASTQVGRGALLAKCQDRLDLRTVFMPCKPWERTRSDTWERMELASSIFPSAIYYS